MKRIFKNLFKALLGIPVTIFLYELFNLTISIILSEYVRVDNFNLNEVIQNYFSYAVFGYAMALLALISKDISKDAGKNLVEKTNQTLSIFLIIFIVLFISEGLILNDMLASILIIAIMSLVIITLLFIVFLLDKKEINKINKKLKEKTNENKH